jgi:hypothetical protein
MSAKRILLIGSATLGIGTAFAVGQWPSHARPVQMISYSVFILGIVAAFLWTQPRSRRLLPAIGLVLSIHGIALLILQRFFPFGTILAILPFAFLEAVILLAVAIKSLGDENKIASHD